MIKKIIMIGALLMPYYRLYVSNNTDSLFKESIKEAVIDCSNKFKIEEALILAIIKVESENKPQAVRYEKHLKRAKWYLNILTEKEKKDKYSFCSMGLMQTLYGNAKSLGFKNSPFELFRPGVSIYWGCKYLSKLHKRYDNVKDIISSYNQGRPRRLKNGKYRNQLYVDTVYSNYLKNKK